MGHNFTDRKDKLALSALLDPVAIEPPTTVYDPTAPLSLHPAFQDIYMRSQNHLLSGDGPLPFTHRHYIAIMACSRYGLDRLAETERRAFLGVGGEPTWLEGIHRAPLKLRRLSSINKVVAHRPWALNQTYIKDLTTGEGSWSLAELVQAIVILVHFHSGSSFVAGCDTPRPAPRKEARSAPGTAPRKETVPSKTGQEKSQSLEGHVRSKQNLEGHVRSKQKFVRGRKGRSLSETKVFKDDLLEQLDSVYTLDSCGQEDTANPLEAFLEDPQYKYIDFHAIQDNTALQLKVHDFSWDDHGFCVMSRFYGDMSLLLDDKLRAAKHLTYNFMGAKKSVDTSLFRRSIWNYIQCLFGIHHDDFDYSTVSRVLTKELKDFVRLSACHPARLNNTDIDTILLNLERSEKVHVKILIMEAKTQALLLYALRAIMDHMA